MIKLIDSLRPIALYLLVLISGLYAGLHISGMLNPLVFGIINPAGDLMPSTTWAASWQITNRFMSVRMGVCGPIILSVYLLTLLLFIRQWRSVRFWLILVAFGLFIADIILSGQQQMPINQYIDKLDFKHITPEQANRLAIMHPQMIHNFSSREWFSIIGFVLVAITPFLFGNRKVNGNLST